MIKPGLGKKMRSIFAKHSPALTGDHAHSLSWHAPWAKPLRLSGFPWFEVEHCYRRLPLKPQDALPAAVNSLANHTAGGQVAFTTDSRAVWLRAWMQSGAGHDHMPQTGGAGFDLYLGEPGQQRFYSVTRFDVHANAYEYLLYDVKEAQRRTFTINFPLYRAVIQVAVGLERKARLWAPPPWSDRRPIVIYGTSITQGGCASRPGMAYTNILSRRLNRQVINLGFSGSGNAEQEVARSIAKIKNPAMFVVDCEANCGLASMKERLANFLEILRAPHKAAPILLVSRIRFARDVLNGDKGRKAAARFQRQLVERLRAAGDRNVHFLDGKTLLGAGFDECTVDGVHATDLGFMRMADKMTPVIAGILRK